MVKYKSYEIKLKRQWDILKQRYNYSVAIEKDFKHVNGFFADNKTKALVQAKKNINKILKK